MKKTALTAIAFFLVCIFCFSGCNTSFSGGKTPSPTRKPYPEQDKYDSVLAEGDGYYLVEKYSETFESAITELGIINEDGEWILPLSGQTIFNDALSSNGEASLKSSNLRFHYLGSGTFIAARHQIDLRLANGQRILLFGDQWPVVNPCSFYCIETGKGFCVNLKYLTPYENGKLLFFDGNSINSSYKSLDMYGNVQTLNVKYGNGLGSTYSEGMIFSGNCFYTIEGELAIDLRSYDLIDTDGIHFNNGQCSIKFKNPGGTVYYATIDKQGNFLVEPHK